MNWAAIKGIASVAGIVGFVISIIILIHELRNNARSIEGATVQSLMTLEREAFGILAYNAELMTKGGATPSELTEVEWHQYERGVGSDFFLDLFRLHATRTRLDRR